MNAVAKVLFTMSFGFGLMAMVAGIMAVISPGPHVGVTMKDAIGLVVMVAAGLAGAVIGQRVFK